MSAHRVTVRSQTWNNAPPYAPHTLYRAACKCGWLGLWHSFKENVEQKCGAEAWPGAGADERDYSPETP